ncbi:phosphomannomutase/phosphoglucomutase [Spiribacter sp. 221]|uniref:phosphomannomutase/phosphoglucomutase n=1 Tax=Spiribacter onubensis TaxID=3122420 RepID=UPI00349F2B82
MQIDPSILRAYDIRGLVDGQLTEDTVRALGQAIGSAAADAGQARIVVGYDGRESSPWLAAALRDGLMASGREVIDIGQVPTPVMYFATYHLETEAGVAVTGSHNPAEYNGLKTIIGGRPLWGAGIQALGRRIKDDDLVEGTGTAHSLDVLDAYRDRIAGDVQLQRRLKVVVDCGNGVPGAVAPGVLETIGADVIPLFCDVDGNFPNHHPDPTVPENLQDLIRAVATDKADLGLAFDGDGDRLGVVDENGHIIWADRQMMLYARAILARHPGKGIVFDVKCSGKLAEVIRQAGGEPVMWKTGHSLIKEKLRETAAPLAGEMSGHLFFNDRWYGFDDAIYAAARLLEILAGDGRQASEIFGELPEPVSTPEIRLDLEEGQPHQLMNALMGQAEAFDDARITTIDGLRMDFDDGWGLVRASNTQPCLVMRFEGVDEEALGRIRERFEGLIRDAGESVGIAI